MNRLPASWALCTIADVTAPVQTIDTARSNDRDILYVDISSIDNLTNRIAEPKRLRLSSAPSRARQILKSGDVLFATVRPYLRNIAQVPESLDGEIASTGFAVLRAVDGVVPSYLFYKSISRDFVAALTGEQYGVSYPAVKDDQVRAQPFELPPTNEQRRIVSKIEELFSELDKGTESLTTARDLLRAYRQSVLRHAFEGKLTEDWRSDKSSWQTLPVAELLCAPLCNGRSVKDRAGGFPVLRLTALKHGRIDLIESKEGAWDRTTAQPFLVAQGDFFVARGNGSKSLVGIGGLVGEVGCDVAFPDTMIRLRLNAAKVDSRYFALCWNSRVLRQQIEREARTTAGIYKINQDHISAFTLPVPPLDEQKIIVSRLEKRLSETDFAHQQVESEIRRADALRQSILKQAFSGQLVPQDASDEPASVLLERIRAEQEAGSPKKRRNNKNSKKEAA